MTGWRNYVKVGAIDCSNEINSQTCRNYEVMAYPTVRYFPPHPDPSNIGKEFIRSDAFTMKNSLVDQLVSTQLEKGNSSTLCDIQPYEEQNVVIDSNYLLTFIIIDKPGSKFAQELIIDYCPVKKVKIIYVLNSNEVLVELLKTTNYPSLYRVQSNTEFTLLTSGHNKTNFTEVINANLETIHMTPFNLIEITTKLYNMLFTNDKTTNDDANLVYLSDLEATLRYSLDHEVISRNTISGESFEALKNYLELLIEYFPSSVRGKKFLTILSDNMLNKQSLSGEELRSFINKYESLLNPYVTRRKWIGCEGSSPMYRRYPCGLWTLFHTLTVQATTKEVNVFTGEQILSAIAGYVKHFFGCTDCAEHFMQMAATIKNNVSTIDDAVLWLWSAHNLVNQRLSGDITEDPLHPKILFPLNVHCETCRQNDTGEWNKNEVLAYLKKKYTSISIKQTQNDKIHSEPQNIKSNQHIVDDDIDNYHVLDEEWKIDVSTCMISYILSCSVLMILFYLLVVKRNCKKNKYIYFILGKM